MVNQPRKDALHARASDALADESVGVDVAYSGGLDPEPSNPTTGSVVDSYGARRDDLDRSTGLIFAPTMTDPPFANDIIGERDRRIRRALAFMGRHPEMATVEFRAMLTAILDPTGDTSQDDAEATYGPVANGNAPSFTEAEGLHLNPSLDMP